MQNCAGRCRSIFRILYALGLREFVLVAYYNFYSVEYKKLKKMLYCVIISIDSNSLERCSSEFFDIHSANSPHINSESFIAEFPINVQHFEFAEHKN